MQTMFSTFGRLMRLAFAQAEQHARMLLIGVVLFGVLLAGIEWGLSYNMKTHMADSLMNMDISEERVEELSQRMQAGDDAALEEMMNEIMVASNRLDSMPENDKNAFIEAKAQQAFEEFVPVTVIFAFLAIFVLLTGASYYTVVVVLEENSVKTVWRHVPPLFLFFLGILFLYILPEFLVTMLGVEVPYPLFGLLALVFVGSRLLVFPIVYLQKKKRFVESLKQSIALTKGHTVALLRQLIFACGCVGMILFITVLAANILSVISLTVQYVLQSMLLHTALATIIVFSFVLAKDILKTKPTKSKK